MLLIDLGIIGTVGLLSYELADRFISDKLISIVEGRKSSCNNDKLLTVGYQGKLIKKPITIDLKVFPSIAIVGITGCGKSRMASYMMKHTKINKVLLNAYADDFADIYFKKRITDIEQIESYLDYLLELDYADKPLLVVIDECMSLLPYKGISKKLHVLLTKNRHKNVFVICLFQELNKSLCPFKSMFSARIAMRTIQTSDLISALGTSLEEKTTLQNRDFIMLSDNLYYGKTYDIN